MSISKILLITVLSWLTGIYTIIGAINIFKYNKIPYYSISYSIINIILIMLLLSTFKFKENE
jgi:hypothetical protein